MPTISEVYSEATKETDPVSDFADVIIASAATAIQEKGVEAPSTEQDVTPGAKFVIPILAPEGVESGDGRSIAPGALTTRDLPLPLMWQVNTSDGHDGAIIVGKIDTVERTEQGLGNARGVFDNGVWGREAERLVRGGFLRGISVDLSDFEASTIEPEELSDDAEGKIRQPKLQIDKAKMIAATLVAKPSFAEATLELVPDDLTEDDAVAVTASATATVAEEFAVTPDTPPREWFDNPKLDKATPINVTVDGRVYGHVAAWETSHIGLPNNVKPPRSRSNYAFFTTGAVTTAEGEDVAVGQLTLTGGHAPLNASAEAAVKHYDDTNSAVADIAIGEDAYGIWVAGAVRPGTTAMQVRALKASAPSGDWRPINGRLELVALCSVNVPGYPIPRASTITASGAEEGHLTALVAAGADYMAALREQEELEAIAAAAKSRVQRIIDEEEAQKRLKIEREFAIERMKNLL